MRRSAITATGRRISLNSFLISLFLNLALLLVLSLFKEHIEPQVDDALAVSFVSLPRTRLQHRSLDLPRQEMSVSVPRDMESQTIKVKPILLAKEIASAQWDPVVTMNTDPTSSRDSDTPSSPVIPRRPSVSPLSRPVGASRRGSGIPGSARRGIGEHIGQVGSGITPRQPMAGLAGTGKNLSGYYNISLVRYEDTSDTVSADALRQLAGAMNRWTKIKTKVIKEPITLDDPELLRVPLVYITSRRAFAFSERERENLQKYLANGGFLLFSNAANSESEARGVANSIEFELWKVISSPAHDLINVDGKHQLYGSFFEPPGSLTLRGIPMDGRFGVIYEDSGYGAAWATAGGDDHEERLKLGVNIIAYALTTSPLVVGRQ